VGFDSPQEEKVEADKLYEAVLRDFTIVIFELKVNY
jgi:hypothetical protein